MKLLSLLKLDFSGIEYCCIFGKKGHEVHVFEKNDILEVEQDNLNEIYI